jgi:DNA primase
VAALIAGFLRYPQALEPHGHALEQLPIAAADAELAALRDRMIDWSLHRPAAEPADTGPGWLEPAGGDPILGRQLGAVARSLVAGRLPGFSFTRPGGDPSTAMADLGHALDAVLARAEIEAALAQATARLMNRMDEAHFADQQRLMAMRDEHQRRLAQLAGNE